jgi:GntR family transcriptional regulator, transcriptional repressor for pyruvate dehydrogenase complex
VDVNRLDIRGEDREGLRRSAVEEVVEFLRFRLQEGEYAAADRLPPERALSEQLGVARPTLRAALDQLRSEGYLETRRGAFGGTFVTDLSLPARRWVERMQSNMDELVDILDFRLAVETFTVELAALRRTEEDLAAIEAAVGQLRHLVSQSRLVDPAGAARSPFHGADSQFHNAVALASHSRRMAQAVSQARGQLFSATIRSVYEDIVAATVEDHQVILDAVRAQDPVTAHEAMAAHLEHGNRRLMQLVRASTTAPAGTAAVGAAEGPVASAS